MKKVSFPATTGQRSVTIESDVLCSEINPLSSKESLKKANAELNFNNDTVHILGQNVDLHVTTTRHYTLGKKNLKTEISTLVCSDDMSPKKKALKLHRQFAHPPAHILKKLVQDSGNKDEEVIDEIERVSKDCKVCLEYKKTSTETNCCFFNGHII